jgi:hypothetical protein
MHFGDWFWKDEILIELQKKIRPHWSMHMCAQAKNVRARLISNSSMHFRDWSWKDELFIKHISNHKKPHRSLHVRTRAKNVCARPKAYVHGLLLIKKHISEIGDEKTKKLLNILLTTKINPLNLTMHMHTLS